MLPSLDSTSLNRSNSSLASVTPSTPSSTTTTTSSEEKQQRRRSTFYVPLVIEDDDEHLSIAAKSPSEVVKDTGLGSQTSLASHTNSTSSKDFKNSSNNNLKKSSSSVLKFNSKTSSAQSTSPRSASTSVKVTTLLFERANSTLGFSTTSSNSSTASSGYRSGSSKASKKMAPPCGFNWSLSGVTDDLTADLDDDSDAAEFIIAMHKNKTTKTSITPPTNKDNTTAPSSSLTAPKRTSKTSLTSAKSSLSSNRLSSLSNKSSLTSVNTQSAVALTKQRAQGQSSAKTKRYGIVLNALDDNGSPRNSLTHSITEQLNQDRKSAGSYKSNTSSNSKWATIAPRTQFNEENDIVVTPSINNTTSPSSVMPTLRKTLSPPINTKTANKQQQTPVKNSSLKSISTTAAAAAAAQPMQNCHNEYDVDDDDDSDISRIQTNTSTPIKMMKSRSRTNILSVPAVTSTTAASSITSLTQQQQQQQTIQTTEQSQNLINVAKIKVSSSSSTTHTKQTNTSTTTAIAIKTKSPTHTVTSPTTTPCVLRIKSKTLPQSLTPSVVLKQGEALDQAANAKNSNSNKKTSALESSIISTTSTTTNCTTVTSLNRKFGGSQSCNLNRDTSGKNVKSQAFITTAFPPKNLFLLKSTPKLSNSNNSATSSPNSDNSMCTPPQGTAANNAKNYPPHPHQITSPAKKSLSFIRRAHSTKLSRSNSLLKSIASQHQQQMHSNSSASNCGTNNGTNFCTGSWGKDFYLQYDVCPLALDELDSYFRAEKCAELIRERFKIFDNSLAATAGNDNEETADAVTQQNNSNASSSMGEGTIRNIDSSSCSCSPSDKNHQQYQQHDAAGGTGEHDEDNDDAGHHSGKAMT